MGVSSCQEERGLLRRLGGLSSKKQLQILCLGSSTWRMEVSLSKQSCLLQAKPEPRMLTPAVGVWKAAPAAGEAHLSIMTQSKKGITTQTLPESHLLPS